MSKPRKIITGLLIGLASALIVKTLFALLPFLENIELLSLDARFRLFADPKQANKDIVLIMIDQISLDYLERLKDLDPESERGQYWPWSRVVYAAVVDYLASGKPRAIVFDLTLKRTDEEGDDLFAQSIRTAGNVYCPLVFTREPDERNTKLLSEETKKILKEQFSIPLPPGCESAVPSYNMVHPPNKTLMTSPKQLGAVNVSKDKDGILRKTSLVYKYENEIFPSLSLSVVFDSWKWPGELMIPHTKPFYLSEEGEMYIWWYGPSRTYEYISFGELYDNWYYSKTNQPDKITRYQPDYFEDKIVFIGTNAPAHGDLHATPIDSIYPGVAIQATIVDNLISGRSLKPVDNYINWLFIITACLLCGLILFITRSFTLGSCGSGLVVVLMPAINFIAFAKSNWWLELTPALVGLALTFTGATLVYYFTEGREKRRIKSAFAKYLAPEVVEEIVRNYRTLKADVGERKDLTILFSDIRGFTTISESLKPEEVVKLLNEYLSHMVEIIFRYGGTLDKYIGDGIMAFFGAPREQVNHAQLGVRAAVEMVKTARELQVKWSGEGKPNLNIGIGINTGEVVVGNIGSEKRLDYTVIGDNVNLAARLEPLNKEYKTNIIISQFTASLLGDKFNLRELGAVQIRGKEKPIIIYEVLL